MLFVVSLENTTKYEVETIIKLRREEAVRQISIVDCEVTSR